MRKIRIEERRLNEIKRKAGELKRLELKQMEAEKKMDIVKRKRMLEERWELVRWITGYIDSNKD